MAGKYIIRIDSNSDTFESISKIFNHYPTNTEADWELAIETEYGTSRELLEYLIGILNSNLPRLSNINIVKDDITVWYLYEYEQQCNMEFDPQILKN